MNIEMVWQDYRGGLKTFLHSNVANPDDVDDLLQDILIKTYQHLDDVKDPSKIKSWLFQVANNAIIDFYRKRAKGKDLREDERWYIEGEKTVHQELSRCIAPFIQSLPADEAKMLSAIELEGLSQKEYAEQYGIKYSTLKSRVQKSRDKLNHLFSDCCDLSLDQQGNIMDFHEKKHRCKGCE